MMKYYSVVMKNEIIAVSMHTWPAPSHSGTPPHPRSTAMAPGHLLPFIVSDVSSLVEFARHHVSLGLNLITEAQQSHSGMLSWQSEMCLS